MSFGLGLNTRRLGFALTLVGASLFAVAPANADSGDGGHLVAAGKHRTVVIDTAKGEVTARLRSRDHVRAVAVDNHRDTVWVVTRHRRLYAYDFGGGKKLDVELPAPWGFRSDDYDDSEVNPGSENGKNKGRDKKADGKGGGGEPKAGVQPPSLYRKGVAGWLYRTARHWFMQDIFLTAELAVDPEDGSVWIGAHRALYHVAADGEVLFEETTGFNVRDLDFDARTGRLWVATRFGLHGRDRDGAVTIEPELGDWPFLKELAFDDHLGELWVVKWDSLLRLDRDGNETLSRDAGGVRGIAPDGQGNIWVNGHPVLYFLDAGGEIRDRVWMPWWGGWTRDLDVDDNTHTLWAVTHRYVGRIEAGDDHEFEPVHRVRRGVRRWLDASRDTHAPTLSLAAPVAEALVPRRPELHLAYADTGVGVAEDTVAVKKDGDPIEVDCEPAPDGAVCMPVAEITNWRFSLTVTVRDRAHNRSEPASVDLVLDTDGDGVPDEIDVYPEDPDRWRLAEITGQQATLDGTAVQLSWDAHSDPEKTAGYRVYRTTANADDRAPVTAELLEEPAHRDETVDNGTGYVYEIFAVSHKETESAPADPVEFFVAHNQTPAKGLAAQRNPVHGLLTWNDAGELYQYRLYRAQAGGEFGQLVDIDAFSHIDENAHWSEFFQYRIATLRSFDNPFTDESVMVEGPRSDPVELPALPPLLAEIQDAAVADDEFRELVVFRETVVVTGEYTNAVGPVTVTAATEGQQLQGVFDDGRFRLVIPAVAGAWTLTVQENLVADRTLEIPFRLRTDEEPPEVSLDATKSRTNSDAVRVNGTAIDHLTDVKRIRLASDRYAGQDFGVSRGGEGSFSGEMPLKHGDNVITATATDQAGNEGSATVTVQREAPLQPTMDLKTPADGVTVTTEKVDVAGTVYTGHSADELRISLGGRTQFPESGNAVDGYPFRFDGVHLTDGYNRLTAHAETPSGETSQSVTITYDPLPDEEEEDGGEAPSLSVSSPRDGAAVETDSLNVSGVVTASTESVDLTVNGTPVTPVGSPTTGAGFDHTLDLSGCAEETRTVDIRVSDAEGRQASVLRDFTCDLAAPAINVTTPGLVSAPDLSVFNSRTLQLTGTVSDANLAGLSINGTSVSLTPEAEEGSYSFDRLVQLPANEERRMALEARDSAGHTTSREYRVLADIPVRVELLSPADGTEILSGDGGATVEVTARLYGLESGQSPVVAVNDGSEQAMTLDGSIAHTTLMTSQTEGEHTVHVRVRDDGGNAVSSASARITLTDPGDVPLEVVRTEPGNNAKGIAPQDPVTVYFNRSIEPSKVEIDVRETVHGKDYDLSNQKGKGFGEYPEPELVTIHRAMESVPGDLAHYPGRQFTTFHPARRFAYGAEVFVDVRYDGDELSRFNYRVQPLPTLLSGRVTDQFGNGLEGIDVRIEELGLSKKTDPKGHYVFGSGADLKKAIPSGRYTLIANLGMKKPAFGTTDADIQVRKGRLNELADLQIPELNPDVPFVRVRSGQSGIQLAGGDLRLDLDNSRLTFPDGRTQGDIHVQFHPVQQIARPMTPGSVPHWLYAVQPAGIRLDGPVSMQIDMPPLYGNRSYVPPDGTLVVMVGLNPSTNTIEPVGVGEVSGIRVVTERPLKMQRLDYLGYALAGDEAQSLLESFRDGEINAQVLATELEKLAGQ